MNKNIFSFSIFLATKLHIIWENDLLLHLFYLFIFSYFIILIAVSLCFLPFATPVSFLLVVLPVLFLPSTLFFPIPIRLFLHPNSPFPTSSVLKPNQAGCILKKECASASVHVCDWEGLRETEGRKGRDEAGSRHLSARGRGWTTQISTSPHRPQTQRALWEEDKHPIDFGFVNGKCTVYKLTVGERGWWAQHS